MWTLPVKKKEENIRVKKKMARKKATKKEKENENKETGARLRNWMKIQEQKQELVVHGTIAERIKKLVMKSKRDDEKDGIEKKKKEKFGNLLKKFQQVPGKKETKTCDRMDGSLDRNRSEKDELRSGGQNGGNIYNQGGSSKPSSSIWDGGGRKPGQLAEVKEELEQQKMILRVKKTKMGDFGDIMEDYSFKMGNISKNQPNYSKKGGQNPKDGKGLVDEIVKTFEGNPLGVLKTDDKCRYSNGGDQQIK